MRNYWREHSYQLMLSSKHTRASMCHLSKIVKKKKHFPNAPIVAWQAPYSTRASSQNTDMVPKANTISYQSTFFPRTLALWNNTNLKIPQQLYQSERLTYNNYL